VPYSVEREDPSPAEAIIIARQKQNKKKDLVALQFLREILIPPIIHQSSSSPGTRASSLVDLLGFVGRRRDFVLLGLQSSGR
jgi:hypothetical protein